ncbi:hypothetical protein [Methylomonas sp. DH-1]|uniref:hypothetical protein n=1 Tax=Methylomonas sp. (strain DH-1) TaxID=1727196 RepID=UPI0012F6375D|nr:hypothetical protein [Methylomonas sp. DH-1]
MNQSDKKIVSGFVVETMLFALSSLWHLPQIPVCAGRKYLPVWHGETGESKRLPVRNKRTEAELSAKPARFSWFGVGRNSRC